MNSVVGICDKNTVYMKKLAESFMQKSDIPLQIMTFSDYSQLIRYLNESSLDVLITDGEFSIDNLDQWQGEETGMGAMYRKEVIQQHIRYILELSDENISTENTGEMSVRVSRYRSSAELFLLIKKLITGHQTEPGALSECGINRIEAECMIKSTGEKGRFRHMYNDPADFENHERCIIAVYSPVGRCGKTSLSVLLSKLLQKREDSILICMDHHSGFFSEDEFNLAELIYCISRENNLRSGESRVQNFAEYDDFVRNRDELTYIPAARSVEDLCQISAVQLCRLLDMLKYESKYHYIVMDLSEGMENLQKVLEQCDFIFMPVLDDCISRCKVEEFEQHMKNVMGQGAWYMLSAKIHRIRLPSAFEAEGIENYYREIIWSDMANAAGGLISQYGI